MVTTTIDLTSYTVGEEIVDVQKELVGILTGIKGIYTDGFQLCAGLDLANKIRDARAVPGPLVVVVNDEQLAIIRGVVNQLIIGPTQLGGLIYNEFIWRIFGVGE